MPYLSVLEEKGPKTYIVLTHAFTKTTGAVPPREILKALKCQSDFVTRFSKDLIEGKF